MRARGFSLVECLVAAVLLAVGLLAIVASQRAVQRLDQLGRRTSEATEAAASRLARLRIPGCAAASSGSTAGDVAEQWSVTPGPLGRASVTVSFLHDARVRPALYASAFRCDSAP
jgi:prepilin-type N-terminal cleavage/methylation domain-containing protein